MNVTTDRGRQVPFRVLIIDDNEDLALSLSCLLQFHGCVVDVAFDGPEGVKLALAEPFDVVFVDLGLPSMSGYEVASAIRAGASYSPVLLAQTAYGQPDDVRRSFEAGFDGHLVKPVPPTEIVRHVLERGTAFRAPSEDPPGGSPAPEVSTPRRAFSPPPAAPTKSDLRTPLRRGMLRDPGWFAVNGRVGPV